MIGDWRTGIVSHYDMARECRWHHGRSEDPAEKTLWKQRLADLGLQTAQTLVEMGDLDGAARHLYSLLPPNKDDYTTVSQMRLALIYLRIGDVSAAQHWLSVMSSGSAHTEVLMQGVLEALSAMSEGHFDQAADRWKGLADLTRDDRGAGTMLKQNQAICLVYLGKAWEVGVPGSSCLHY